MVISYTYLGHQRNFSHDIISIMYTTPDTLGRCFVAFTTVELCIDVEITCLGNLACVASGTAVMFCFMLEHHKIMQLSNLLFSPRRQHGL